MTWQERGARARPVARRGAALALAVGSPAAWTYRSCSCTAWPRPAVWGRRPARRGRRSRRSSDAVTGPAVAAAEAAGVRTVVQVVDDRPAQALVAAAEQHDAEVIVVGIWNESPLRGLLLGSVAHKLLQLSDRPVLCVPGGDS